jgi:TonB-linked SusC/RagA family outer membrane protein
MMKLSILIILFTAFQVRANDVNGQTVTMQVKGTEIRKILNTIEKQGSVRFLYNADLQGLKKKVDFSVENLPFRTALDQLLATNGLTFKVLDNNLVVMLSQIATENREISVTGKVTGANDEPLSGVSVREKGTSSGTATDNNGMYALTVSNNAILQFSNIGYETQEVPVAGQSVINVKLVQSTKQMEQVVVIGYGTQRKKDITSAITTVNTNDIKNRPIVDPAEVLAGKASGVQVFQPSGKPGSDFSVRIRGIASVLGTSQPVYVIDGVIANDTRSLDPNNIESISILKDASAAGVYGTAGATNGVVLITTKKGTKGRSRVEVNGYTGIQKIVKKLDLLNGPQLAELLVEEKRNAGDNTFNVNPSLLQTNIDWQDEVYRTAQMTGVNLGFSGGSDKGTYYLGLGYLDQEGIVINSNFKRYSLKFNLEQSMNKWLTVGTHTNYNRTNSRDVPDNSRVNQGGVVLGALGTPAFVGKFNPDGTFALNPFQAWENPLASIEGPSNKTISNFLFGDIFGEATILRDFKLRTQLGISLNNWNWDYFLDPFRTQYGRSKGGIGQNTNGETFRYIWDNTLTYTHAFDRHAVTGTLVAAAMEEKATSGSQYGENFANAAIPTLGAASSNKSIGTTKTEFSGISYIGRVSYSFNDKYLMTASLRADGSSRFGSEDRWGYFPAVSAGWRISKENFFSNVKAVNDLKLRVGYGETGNWPNDLYPTFNKLGAGPNYSWGGVFHAGIVPINPIGNPRLKWEGTKQVNAGFDVSLLNNRLNLSVDLYNKNTKDLIFQEQVPRSTGLEFRFANAPGKVQNKGIEFTLTGDVFQKQDFTWNSSLNLSFNKNRIKDVDSGRLTFFGNIPERSDAVVFKNDLPLGAFWGFISEGVDPATGNIKFRDLNGDNEIDPDHDRAYLGSALPKFTFGFTNSLSYKGLSLSFLIDGVSGNKVLNATRIETEGMFDVKNSSAETLRRWKKAGDVTDIPRAVFADPDQNSRISSLFIEDGAFLRIRNLTLSYSLNNNMVGNWGITGIRIYATAQNLHTFTDYKGYHPEVNSFGTNAIAQGIDYGTYPQAKVFTIGLNLEL